MTVDAMSRDGVPRFGLAPPFDVRRCWIESLKAVKYLIHGKYCDGRCTFIHTVCASHDRAMDIGLETESFLCGRHVAFVGKLGGMNRREASQLARQRGATPVELDDPDVDLVVIGADELPLDEDVLLGTAVHEAAAEGRLEIISETELWQRLGFVDEDIDRDIRRLYTPAMLADLLGVPVSVIRRWHRRTADRASPRSATVAVF